MLWYLDIIFNFSSQWLDNSLSSSKMHRYFFNAGILLHLQGGHQEGVHGGPHHVEDGHDVRVYQYLLSSRNAKFSDLTLS